MVALGALGRDETLIEKVQRERRGGPRTVLGRTLMFKGHAEKLQSAKALEEEGADVGGAKTLSSCREGRRRAWMTPSSAAEASGETGVEAHPLGLAT